MNYFVYILKTNANTLYTGQTNNLERRIKEHKDKKAKTAKYLNRFESFELVYFEKHRSRRNAMKRESEIKKLKKYQKEKLILN